MPTAHFYRVIFVCSVLVLLPFALGQEAATKPVVSINHPALLKLHWQLACQASTFGDITFFEMVEQLHAMGVHHIELAAGQRLSDDIPGVKIGPEMSGAGLDALQAKLKSVKMDVVSYGSVAIDGDAEGTKKAFDFAKRLKAKNLVVRATKASLEGLDKMATEAGVHVAVVQPGGSESGDAHLKEFEGRSAFVGVCLDVSAAGRSGVSAADLVSKLGSRVVEVNLNDVVDKKILDDTLRALKEQKFKGIFAVQSSGVERWGAGVNAFSSATGVVAGSP